MIGAIALYIRTSGAGLSGVLFSVSESPFSVGSRKDVSTPQDGGTAMKTRQVTLGVSILLLCVTGCEAQATVRKQSIDGTPATFTERFEESRVLR